MEKSSQIAWKIVPLRHFFPLKVVPLIEVLLYEVFAEKLALRSATVRRPRAVMPNRGRIVTLSAAFYSAINR
jgi:hypothetical protein